MCQTAMRLTQPSADLTTLWSELGGVDEDAGGLPSLLAVSVMVPTSSPKDVERFLRKYGRNEVSHCNAKSSWPCGSFLAAVFFQNTGEPLPKFLRIIGARALRSKPLPSPSPSPSPRSRLLKYATRGFAIAIDQSLYKPELLDLAKFDRPYYSKEERKKLVGPQVADKADHGKEMDQVLEAVRDETRDSRSLRRQSLRRRSSLELEPARVFPAL